MKVKSTLLYGATGSFESLTLSKWKKLRVAKHKPSGNFSNITQRVLDQRAAMKLTVALFKQVAASVYSGYVEQKNTIGQYAAFISYILKNAVSFVTPGSPSVTYANIRVANGSMPTTATTVPTADVSDNKITVTFPATSGYKQAATDMLQLAIYNSTQSKWLVLSDVVARSTGTIDITPPAGFLVAANVLNVHTFFAGQPSTDTANTASDDVVVNATVTA